jgi:hypothetical protein
MRLKARCTRMRGRFPRQRKFCRNFKGSRPEIGQRNPQLKKTACYGAFRAPHTCRDRGPPTLSRSGWRFCPSEITWASEAALTGRQLYDMSDLEPADIDAAILYDHFGPTVLMSLEAYGFCSRGEAREFIRNGNIEIGGTLPVNTHGGQVGEAYIHGMNGIAEEVRQLRGCAANQVVGAGNILVTAGIGVPTSGAILGIDS